MLTINEAIENAYRTIPDKAFLFYRESVFTYKDVYMLSVGLSEFFISKNIKAYDKICLLLPRVPELIISLLASMHIGAVAAAVSYTSKADEITKTIGDISPAAVIFHMRFKHLIKLDKDKQILISVGGDTEGSIPWSRACYASLNRQDAEIGRNNIAYLNCTTGSSGTPKAALATHDNIYWNSLSAIETFAMSSEDVLLCMFASFAHPHELFVRSLYTGGSVVLLEEINPRTIAAAINQKSVTCMMGLAPMYKMLTEHCKGMKLDSLRIAESGGMYTSGGLIRDFINIFGIPILSVWGSTETTGIAIANRRDDYRDDGSMGKVCPYYEVRITDDAGKDLGDKEIGELVFRGAAVVSGYYGVEQSLSFCNGWYHSGDLGFRDSQGYYYFVERKSGLLKVAGLKVYPLQVEIALQAHSAVKETAVIGIEDRLRGEIPKAYIIPQEGVKVTERELRDYCKTVLADYMIPVIEFAEDLPRIGSGKIDKKTLKDKKRGCL
ncbi:Long-chain-fatty-acid--CoA ligase [Candidatus Magnetoovum chiemensis]|nr:Long-chain-fatty-acid--CoA ligase [Candidatus Magnetoovum chiemensis]